MRILRRTVTLLAAGSLLLLVGVQLGALPNPTAPMTFRKLTPNLMFQARSSLASEISVFKDKRKDAQ